MTLSVVTANEIIIDALQKLGVYAPGEIPTDPDASVGLAQLNDIIDDWLGDSIYLYQIVEISAPLTAGTQDYTIGPGGMVDTPRPIRVTIGRGVATLDGGSVVDSVSALEWNAIYAPANNVVNPVSAAPAAMYYEPQFPYGLLSVSPVPKTNVGLVFPAWYGMTGFATLATQFAMAPAQEQALKSNLAIALNPYFGASAVSPELVAMAQETKTTLTLTNRLSRAMAMRNRQLPARGIVPRGVGGG